MKSLDCSCISKRAKTVNVNYRMRSRGPVRQVVIDATGLNLFGEGEWKVRKHSKEKCRILRMHKVHLAIDADAHEIVNAEVSLDNVHDSECYTR